MIVETGFKNGYFEVHSMHYVIGSFNIQDFNLTKSFDKLAEIILSENMDVVGIQEVNSKTAVDLLVNALNRRSNLMAEWKGSFPTYPRSRDESGESYAFIWNERRLSLVDVRGKENPRLIENFSIKGIPGQRELLRNPYFARFTAKGHLGGSNFEIRLINTHIRFSKGIRDIECLDTKEQMRKNELDLLVKEILPYCGDIRTGNNMPAYTFLLGDYNLCLDNSGGGSCRIDEIMPGNQKTWKRYYRTVQNLPTSLKRPNSDSAIKDDEDIETEQLTEITDYYSKNYDHFSYDIELEDKMLISPSRVEAVDSLYKKETDRNERLKLYRDKISDHVPIKITVDLTRG